MDLFPLHTPKKKKKREITVNSLLLLQTHIGALGLSKVFIQV